MKAGDRNETIALYLILIWMLLWALPSHAQHVDADHATIHDHSSSHDHRATATQWEGSPEGKAYSEFNHHLAGIFVILIALSEAQHAFRVAAVAWACFLLPLSMAAAGLFLIIWSDHDGWPIGPMTLSQTFFTGDWETVQHKWFGILLLLVGGIEWLRRSGKLEQERAKFSLPMFAIIGGLSLFLHSHGDHPSGHEIALHHAVMGIMAVAAGSSKLFSGFNRQHANSPNLRGPITSSPWELTWAGLILLIGIQLLIYRE